jgi:WD40 repeat protein
MIHISNQTIQDEFQLFSFLSELENENASYMNKISTDLSKYREENIIHETTITSLREELSQSKGLIRNLTQELDDAKNRARLAEIQFDGLKSTIDTLQEQNDEFRKSHETLIGRLVSEKEKSIEQMNEMTELVDRLKKEVDMLRGLLEQEEKRKYWKDGTGLASAKSSDDHDTKNHRRFGATGVIIPSTPKAIVRAHSSQGTAVRYDSSGSDLVATASEDSTVKLWDTGNGTLKGTFKGSSSGNTILGLDIVGGVIAGGGTDKMCRVWNTRTERMVM